MKKIIILFILVCNVSFAQTLKCPKNAIIYEVPENIQNKLDSAARRYSNNFTNKYNFVYFSNPSGNIAISFDSSKSLDDKRIKLLKYTMRYLHIKDKYYPVIFPADYDLSTIVNIRKQDGLIETSSYIGTPYYITFKLIRVAEAIILEEGSIQ